MLRALLPGLSFLILPTALVAESFYERELQQLTEQRDRALAAAAAPINRNYQTALEQLLLRTTRNKDIEASARVVAALRAIGASAGAPALPVATDAPPPAGAMTKAQIEDLLTSKVWVHVGQFHYKFTRDGRISLVEDKRKGKFQIDEKTGFVSFLWENGLFPGEGVKVNPDGLSLTHNRGGAFLPAPK